MKVLDRLGLLDRIGRELQKRMTFPEIDIYLKAYGVDTKKPTSGVNSKWVYSKELLSEVKDDVILQIADELEIPHNYAVAPAATTVEALFWEPFHFKLFISHISTFKKRIGQLQRALRSFGISAFVAHVDIEPTKEWLDEVESGLYSMDALAAILMPGFKGSDWTDQEVGIAVGRGVLIIPVIRGLLPYGFISKYQGLRADGKSVGAVAEEIFRILAFSPRTRTRMLSCLMETVLQSASPEEASEKLGYLASVDNLPVGLLERLKEAAPSSVALSSLDVISRLNALLAKYKVQPVASEPAMNPFFDDDIPF